MLGGSSQLATVDERAVIKSNRWAQRRQHSRKVEGAAEHLIDSSEKRICRLSFGFYNSHVTERRSKVSVVSHHVRAVGDAGYVGCTLGQLQKRVDRHKKVFLHLQTLLTRASVATPKRRAINHRPKLKENHLTTSFSFIAISPLSH